MPTRVQSGQLDFAKEEERILAYWREIDAFGTQLKLSEGRPEFSFYDGPPFATGLPHYGHLLAGTIKDVVLHPPQDIKSFGDLDGIHMVSPLNAKSTKPYPLCWRSKTPLLYRATPAWFFRVEPIVDQLEENNLSTTYLQACPK